MSHRPSADHQREARSPVAEHARGEAEGDVGIDRILAFSDGVIAIAITLLVLNLTVPRGSHNLLNDLGKNWPEYVSYVMSFGVIGIIWAQHHQMFRNFRRSDHVFFLINVLFLMWIVSLPFSTSLLAEYLGSSQEGVAMEVYAGSWLVGALLFNVLWRYAIQGDRLLDEHADRKAIQRITSSYNVGPISYLAVFVLAFLSARLSLALFLALAVFYAVAPLLGSRS